MSAILNYVQIQWGELDKENPLSHMLHKADEVGLLNELLERASEIRKHEKDMDTVDVCAHALHNLSY